MTDDPGLTQPAQPIPPPPPPPPAGSNEEQLRATFVRQEEYTRFLPLVKWLLVFPHLVVLFLLAIGAFVAHVIAWFAVVITRRYPVALFNFAVGVQRWSLRVASYYLLMNDTYPPFSLDDDPEYPTRLEIDYPEDGTARWRPFFVGILVIPYFIVGLFLFFAAYVAIIIAFFAILFTKKFPEGVFNLTAGAFRWQQRANAYNLFLITKYPPWRLGP